MKSALQLRMLIRNDEARIEHLTSWANGLRAGDLVPADLDVALDRAHAQLVRHCLAFQQFSPAASSLAKVAPSCDAARPAPILQNQ